MPNPRALYEAERAAANAVSLLAANEPGIGAISYMPAERLAMAALDAVDYRGAVGALEQARDAIHRLCLERGSTDGYVAVFEAINAHQPGSGSDG